MKALGFTHCAVYARPEDHAAIRELAAKLQRKHLPEAARAKKEVKK